MKVTIRATYWPRESKEGLPIVRMEPESGEEKKLCREIIDQGCAYGFSLSGMDKDAQILGIEVILMKKP